MRKSKIFLNIILLKFSFGGENDFSMMLTMDKVKKGKDMAISVHGRIWSKAFIFSVWLFFGKNIKV